MFGYLLKRLLIAIPTLLAISAVIFFILALSPGNPLGDLATNPAITPEVRETFVVLWGWISRFIFAMSNGPWLLFTGNLGYSFTSRLPVSELIAQRLPTTLWIIGIAYLVSVGLAFPLGITAALRRDTWIDRGITTLAFMGFSTPTFFSGLVFIIIFSVRLGWLPFIYDNTLVVERFG
jgi:peptide/nickel transport system permease protein